MTPTEGALRLLLSALVGAILGLVYGFLRPLRPRLTGFADSVFSLAAVTAWVIISFPICRGDIRPVFFFAMVAGCLGWEMTVGRFLRGIFSGFWKPSKIFLKFLRKKAKKLFATGKKSVTICGLKIRNRPGRKELAGHGTHQESAQEGQIGLSP